MAGSAQYGGQLVAVRPTTVLLLLNRFVFLRLSDIAHALLSYEEVVHPLPLPEDITDAYRYLEHQAVKWGQTHRGSGMTRFLQALLAYPDQPWTGETLTAVVRD